jgi:hypothetical protein
MKNQKRIFKIFQTSMLRVKLKEKTRKIMPSNKKI